MRQRVEDYLIPQRLMRAVRVRTFKDHVTSNILDSQVTNNSRCFQVPPTKSEPYRQTLILCEDYHWLESCGKRYSGCSIDWNIPGTLSEHSVLLVAGLCALSSAALISVLVLQCFDTDTGTDKHESSLVRLHPSHRTRADSRVVKSSQVN